MSAELVRTDVRRSRGPFIQATGAELTLATYLYRLPLLGVLGFLKSERNPKALVRSITHTHQRESRVVECLLALHSVHCCRVRKDLELTAANGGEVGAAVGSPVGGRKVAVRVWPGWLGSCPPKKLPCGGRSVSKLLQGRAGGHQLKRPSKQCNRNSFLTANGFSYSFTDKNEKSKDKGRRMRSSSEYSRKKVECQPPIDDKAGQDSPGRFPAIVSPTPLLPSTPRRPPHLDSDAPSVRSPWEEDHAITIKPLPSYIAVFLPLLSCAASR